MIDFLAFVERSSQQDHRCTDRYLDGFIISGHRRYAAAKSLAWTLAVRTADLYHDTHDSWHYRDYNYQRVKSIDEVLAGGNRKRQPGGSYADLLQYRQQAAKINVETGVISGKARAKLLRQRPFLNAIESIIDRLSDFLPSAIVDSLPIVERPPADSREQAVFHLPK